MCGICGIFSFRWDSLVDQRLLDRMMSRIYHRGPDDRGSFVKGNIGIGMQRLSIIDLEGGRQPIANEGRTVWVVFNGEIYNYVELKAMLETKGHRFATRSDTEVLVHLYEEEGESFVEKLRGMFAFALWDSEERKLVLGRDRIGIKPLYYYSDEQKLLFGSEIKAILECQEIRTEIDLQALDAFLAYTYIPAPLTIYRNIFKLLPGHILICSEKGVQIRSYWDVKFGYDDWKTMGEIEEEFREVFREAVKLHLISDVPVGVFLSGGVDSSLVTAFAMAMNGGLRTFTMGFGGNIGAYEDERGYARLVAERYQTAHREFEVKPSLDNVLDKIVVALDEPLADDGVIPTYYICREASRHIKVGLTGLGGDEMFAGYERYLGFRLHSFYRMIPRFLREKVLVPVVNRIPEPENGNNFIHHAKRFIRSSVGDDEAHAYLGFITTLAPDQRCQLYKPDVVSKIDLGWTEELMLSHHRSSDAEDPMDRVFYQDIKTYLPDDLLNITDKLSMAHSIELRVPFVDDKVVEYCLRIPSYLKLRGWKKKFLLKKVAREFLPAEVIDHKKLGFSSPMASWLKHDLKDYACQILCPDSLEKHGLFQKAFVKQALEDHFEHRENNEKLIFSLIMFQKWFDLYM